MLAGGSYGTVTPQPQRRRADLDIMSPEHERLLLTARRIAHAHEDGDDIGVRLKLDELSCALINLDEAAAGPPLT